MATKEYGKRDPSSHRTPEQIHATDHGYNYRPDRANGGHGGNNMANLRVRSRHANRGWDKKR
jgi:hypothetical protein